MNAIALSLVLSINMASGQQVKPMYNAGYAPQGPKIKFTVKSRGSFVIQTDKNASPKTVEHIVELVKKKFYDGIRMHRVGSWLIQYGDPLSKTAPLNDKKMGDGGSGKDVPFEKCNVDFTRGIVGVASEGLQRGGDCQLFVLKADTLRLFQSYAVVGMVCEGMDVVDKIQVGDRITSAVIVAEKAKGK